jgi:hypothetical protein
MAGARMNTPTHGCVPCKIWHEDEDDEEEEEEEEEDDEDEVEDTFGSMSSASNEAI